MRRRAVLLFLTSTLVWGCDRAPSAEGLPEWKPSDHDRLADQAARDRARATAPLPSAPPAGPTDAGAARTDASTSRPGDAGAVPSASPSAGGGEALAEVAWNSLCVTCHGPGGRGDGPQGPMVHPPDFTDRAWQASRTDAELLHSIENGKNKMPKFDLPERTRQALLQRVRGLAH